MDILKILDRSQGVTWDYDEEADVLYLSIGEPKAAVGLDAGDGVILRYDEEHQELVGVTLVGLRARLVQRLGDAKEEGSAGADVLA
jgi:uncharacterized protein YuzE